MEIPFEPLLAHYSHSRPAATLVSGPLARCPEATGRWIVRLERLLLRRMPCIEQASFSSRPMGNGRWPLLLTILGISSPHIPLPRYCKLQPGVPALPE
jgi:hypothetical protein